MKNHQKHFFRAAGSVWIAADSSNFITVALKDTVPLLPFGAPPFQAQCVAQHRRVRTVELFFVLASSVYAHIGYERIGSINAGIDAFHTYDNFRSAAYAFPFATAKSASDLRHVTQGICTNAPIG